MEEKEPINACFTQWFEPYFTDYLLMYKVMSEKVCKILLVLALMLGVPQAWGKFVMLIYLCHFT